MCGRYTLQSSADLIREVFDLPDLPGFEPRYNIAPSQPVPAVHERDGHRHLDELRWGLVPYWARDPAIGNRMINVRSETVTERPAFREPFARRRCVIPADGFYEWQRLGDGLKQPFHIGLPDGRPFAFAGLWERWRDRSAATTVESCAILTTDANDLVAPIHDRMPVILDPSDAAVWLFRDATPERLLSLLAPFGGELTAIPVSTLVNDPRNDDRRCIDPVVTPPRAPTLFD